MTRRTVASAATVVLLAGLLPGALPAARIPIDTYEVSCAVDAGTQFPSHNGKRFHIRGAMQQSILYDVETFEIVGQNAVVVNGTLRTKTGVMNLCGTFSSMLSPWLAKGTFDGTWSGRVKGPDEPMENGRAVGRGTLGLDGWKVTFTLRGAVDPDQMPAELLAILAEAPWTDCDEVSVSRATGFVRPKASD